jgi:hypothetical protein
MSDRDYVNANMWDGKYPENFNPDIAGNVPSRAQAPAFAQTGRIVYPVRMSDRDYVNANMWDGKYPENFDSNVAGNAASRVQGRKHSLSQRKQDDFDSTSIAGPQHTD